MTKSDTQGLIVPDWAAPDNIIAYTTTRQGGVSDGPYSSLNLGAHVHDNIDNVRCNRQRLPFGERITWLNQIHSATCIPLAIDADNDDVPDADAAISSHPQHFCAVMTADCVPILLCDKLGRQVAAVHGGWKGLYNGVISNTIAQFTCPPKDILAWIGPAISQQNYQVDQSLALRFSRYPGAVKADTTEGKYLLDLPLVAECQLRECGLSDITHSRLCTYAQPETFYSHRYATHQSVTHTGRIASVIGLNG